MSPLRPGHAFGVGLAALGGFLILGVLAWYVHSHRQPPPVNARRIAERRQALAQTRSAETQALHQYRWIDPARKVVQVPIHRAMQLVVEEWKNPAHARSNLAARAEAARAPVPNPYE
jgi:hypothetical protein